jgi:hypothetical protein
MLASELSRHGSAEGLLLREQTGFGFSDADVGSIDEFLMPLHQYQRCVADLLRPPLYFSRHYGTAEQMRPHTGSKIRPTPGTQIRTSTKGIGGQLHHLELKTARKALRDVVFGAVHEQQGALFGRQSLGARAV